MPDQDRDAAKQEADDLGPLPRPYCSGTAFTPPPLPQDKDLEAQVSLGTVNWLTRSE